MTFESVSPYQESGSHCAAKFILIYSKHGRQVKATEQYVIKRCMVINFKRLTSCSMTFFFSTRKIKDITELASRFR
jgi:hypothetical protein